MVLRIPHQEKMETELQVDPNDTWRPVTSSQCTTMTKQAWSQDLYREQIYDSFIKWTWREIKIFTFVVFCFCLFLLIGYFLFNHDFHLYRTFISSCHSNNRKSNYTLVYLKKKGGIKSVCLRKDSHASNSLFANEMDHLETFGYSKHFQETRVPPKID